MRQKNIKMQIVLRFPFDHPDENGVVYSKQAVEQAISSLHGKLPVLYRDNGMYLDGAVIGCTSGNTPSALWNEDYQICEVFFDANIYYGGIECLVKDMENGIVTSFEITSLGISK
ncbi:hypothetical protein CE91St46_09640 [Eubacteriales bacterium]|nr:hypothetical protein CE91St46_09640 [Eubacteriales bacterium]GKH62489.1 hypothetical protein CE91St47_09580 [Eubacteriales bacterium]